MVCLNTFLMRCGQWRVGWWGRVEGSCHNRGNACARVVASRLVALGGVGGGQRSGQEGWRWRRSRVIWLGGGMEVVLSSSSTYRRCAWAGTFRAPLQASNRARGRVVG